MITPEIDAIHRVASTPKLLVALDFDGTLAPTVDDPATSRAIPGASAAIEALVRTPDTVAAIVSGRHLVGLQEVVTVPPEVILIGSHGAEILIDGEETGPTLTPEEHELLESVCSAVESVAARFLGARMERKPSGCGLHTRLASAEDSETAREETLAAVHAIAGSAGVTERDGKDILEFIVRAADKGSALQWLRELLGATSVVFIGDDVTDEDGFRSLTTGDVGIKVGEGESTAEFRVADPGEATDLLAMLVTARYESRRGTSTCRTP